MNEIVIGRNAVLALLNSDRSVNQIFINRSSRKNDKIDQIIALAKKKRIKLAFVPRQKIDKICSDSNHQGILAYVPPTNYANIEDILRTAKQRNEPPFIILLDSIQDPHNFGAIIRTAVAAGVHGIIIPKNKSAHVTQTVTKVSAGTVENCNIVRVGNLVNTMKQLKKEGFWFFAADQNASKIYNNADYRGAIGLVMGGEGKGLHRLVKENCDFFVRIPMAVEVESLNVSVSAALLIYKAFENRSKI